MRRDKTQNTIAKSMKDVCYKVKVEPKLQAIEGESFDHKSECTEDEACLDFHATDLWECRFSRTYFCIKIFNPIAKSLTTTGGFIFSTKVAIKLFSHLGNFRCNNHPFHSLRLTSDSARKSRGIFKRVFSIF